MYGPPPPTRVGLGLDGLRVGLIIILFVSRARLGVREGWTGYWWAWAWAFCYSREAEQSLGRQ